MGWIVFLFIVLLILELVMIAIPSNWIEDKFVHLVVRVLGVSSLVVTVGLIANVVTMIEDRNFYKEAFENPGNIEFKTDTVLYYNDKPLNK